MTSWINRKLLTENVSYFQIEGSPCQLLKARNAESCLHFCVESTISQNCRVSKKIYVVVFLLLCVHFSLAAAGLLSCIGCVDIYATNIRHYGTAVNRMLFPPHWRFPPQIAAFFCSVFSTLMSQANGYLSAYLCIQTRLTSTGDLCIQVHTRIGGLLLSTCKCASIGKQWFSPFRY